MNVRPKEMWAKLKAWNYYWGSGATRPVNARNEWAGYSDLLGMPVFTGWFDLCAKPPGKSGGFSCLVHEKSPDAGNPHGSKLQERLIRMAMAENNGEAAFFVVTAADVSAKDTPRKIKFINSDRVYIGTIVEDEVGHHIVVKRIVEL